MVVLGILPPHSSAVSSGTMFPLASLPFWKQMAKDLKRELL